MHFAVDYPTADDLWQCDKPTEALQTHKTLLLQIHGTF